METYTREQIERGEGRFTDRPATVIQREREDVFGTVPAEPGWTVGPGWHIAGIIRITTPVEWVDLW